MESSRFLSWSFVEISHLGRVLSWRHLQRFHSQERRIYAPALRLKLCSDDLPHRVSKPRLSQIPQDPNQNRSSLRSSSKKYQTSNNSRNSLRRQRSRWVLGRKGMDRE